jgi:hypothetical protein
MPNKLVDEFYWRKDDAPGNLPAAEMYNRIAGWAGRARGQNPGVFDALSDWILDDSQWTQETLAENEQVLLNGVFKRFKQQNADLREQLLSLKPSGVVNEAVFKALDRFDDELSGKTQANELKDAVTQMFADFSVMLKRSVREQIAGQRTGPTGTDSVNIFGFINLLKDCDAGVQWALFMPDVVKNQQQGFKVENFEYRTMPAMRFIGREGDEYSDIEARIKLFKDLDALAEHKSGFDYDALFMHHYGKGVDVGEWHGVWGRFFKADTPVPEGYLHFDFTPKRSGHAGPPYISQFAYAVFSGDFEAMHKREGFDSDAMYDITRNIMLGQGVNIPDPDKYWTAEVFPEGMETDSTEYMFSAEF